MTAVPVRGYEGDKEGDVRARYEGFMRRYIRLPLTLALALILTLTITIPLTLALTLTQGAPSASCLPRRREPPPPGRYREIWGDAGRYKEASGRHREISGRYRGGGRLRRLLLRVHPPRIAPGELLRRLRRDRLGSATARLGVRVTG